MSSKVYRKVEKLIAAHCKRRGIEPHPDATDLEFLAGTFAHTDLTAMLTPEAPQGKETEQQPLTDREALDQAIRVTTEGAMKAPAKNRETAESLARLAFEQGITHADFVEELKRRLEENEH